MTDLNNLNIESILDMSQDQAIEHLRQIRLSRRNVVKKPTTKSKIAQAKVENIKTISAEDAANLLKMLEGL